ncbi:MAG: 5-amino-6-(D-ribitylamino)uracil--L-tyrosine 4-hydroxyphenyl transferase CofH [Actinomycetota bacterium]|nr:5-amino-6-(D-ribitylamino)uracil--L-tyrosine 4-hydroxyphenyl transferase CofH [Actinomycetota bacterium]
MAPDLVSQPLATLLDAASARRRSLFGNRVTYSPKVFLPLTRLCRDRCGYCTFATAPARLPAPFLSPDEVLSLARAGAVAGCHEALFTLGERPELRYSVARDWLAAAGYSSTVEYLAAMCALVVSETGLLPHANGGALHSDELARLRPVSASQGMMLESLNPNLECHIGSPDKTPERRLATLEAAGALGIPFTTGVLVGIGESRADRLEALEAIAASHRRHGHVQEVIVQNFRPKDGTAMRAAPACPGEEELWTIAAARLVLPDDVHLQAPPNLSDDFATLLDAGIDDWGGVSPVTPDHVNPERPWPEIDRLREVTEGAGYTLAPRLTAYPEFVSAPERWLDPTMRPRVLDRSDAEGLARDDLAWFAGAEVAPPALFGTGRSRGPVGEVLEGVLGGQTVGLDEIVTLFSARGPEVAAVGEVADELRRRAVGETVTWVANRNINYTNVCTFRCRFCAFSKGPLSLNLRGDPYLLGIDEIQRRVVEAVDAGATEVCLQGGIHPSFDGNYYVDVCRAVTDVAPGIHVHGFTALEVTEGAKRLDEPLADYLRRLIDVGLRSLPGTAAEILDDEIRALLCPDKIDTDEWLDAHRTAHSLGLRSNITIMFGAIEHPRHWALHLLRTRALQAETGGFTEFVPLPFVHMAAPMYLQGKARRGPTFREALLMHSVARIVYGDLVPNIQVSWVKMGVEGSRQALRAGVNDLGGTLIDENISRAAGASHGQHMDEASFREIVEPLGRPLEQRTTLYGRVATAV